MQTGRAMRDAKGTGLAPWQLERAVHLLKSEQAADHPVAALAAACGLSRSHFSRAFKASTGLPPHQWLLRHRVECACTMLARPGQSISQIALACGFADQSHLTRVFHEIIGASPADWRRRTQVSGIAAPS